MAGTILRIQVCDPSVELLLFGVATFPHLLSRLRGKRKAICETWYSRVRWCQARAQSGSAQKVRMQLAARASPLVTLHWEIRMGAMLGKGYYEPRKA
ncbi:hypothetical protein N7494_012635 [Penicillium frequentans]|uniref:Uncharacterized protein n=1 Tax=Penicillium frequentans TaxID=3151616 RepID=A0AAD6CM60_9EURO|nr:hypothetical protein N7494_012635 [Penicillium glabrum]